MCTVSWSVAREFQVCCLRSDHFHHGVICAFPCWKPDAVFTRPCFLTFHFPKDTHRENNLLRLLSGTNFIGFLCPQLSANLLPHISDMSQSFCFPSITSRLQKINALCVRRWVLWINIILFLSPCAFLPETLRNIWLWQTLGHWPQGLRKV